MNRERKMEGKNKRNKKQKKKYCSEVGVIITVK